MHKYIKTLFTNKSLFSDKSNESYIIAKFRLDFLDKYKKTSIYICIYV
jgi:hypothetical protein